MSPDNVTEFAPRSFQGDGGGSDIDARPRAVELDIRELKTDMKHVATKAWILGGVLGGMGVAAAIATALFRLLSD